VTLARPVGFTLSEEIKMASIESSMTKAQKDANGYGNVGADIDQILAGKFAENHDRTKCAVCRYFDSAAKAKPNES